MHPYTHTHTSNGHSSHHALVPCWNARTLSDVMNWSWLELDLGTSCAWSSLGQVLGLRMVLTLAETTLKRGHTKLPCGVRKSVSTWMSAKNGLSIGILLIHLQMWMWLATVPLKKKNKNVFLKHLFNQIGTWLKDHQSSFYSVWTMGGLRSQGAFRIHGQDGDGTEICVLGPVEVCWATPWKSPKSTCTLGRADALPIAVVHRPLAVSF